MKKIMASLLAVTVVFYVGILFSQAHAEELTAKLSDISGDVKIIKAGQQEEIPAETGMELNPGDIVKTGAESFVTVTFLPNTYIELASESELRVTKFELNPQTSKLTGQIDVLSGHISRAIMNGLPRDAAFDIVLSDYVPLEVEGYSEPGQLPDITAAACKPKEGQTAEEALSAVISNVSGIVEVFRVGSVKAIQAANGMELNVGDRLKTGKGSFATISFLPETFIKITDNSDIRIIRNGVDQNCVVNTRVDVLSGHLSEVTTKGLPPESKFEIVLVDYIPLHAEGYHPPETVPVTVTPVNFNRGSDS